MRNWKSFWGLMVFLGLVTASCPGDVSAKDEAKKKAVDKSGTASDQGTGERGGVTYKAETNAPAAEGSDSMELEGSGSHQHEGSHAAEEMEEGSH
ncbi:MAG: hypothetical protein AB7G75_19915 [Candidatus Binatia bacterium]